MKCNYRKYSFEIIYFIFVFVLIGHSSVLTAQLQPTDHLNPTPLEEVIQSLEENYEVFFNYKSADIATVTTEFIIDPADTIDEALVRLSLSTDLKFELTNEKYIIVYGKDITKQDSRSFRGIIKDAETNEPIQYANIFYKNNQRIGTLSEPNGKFVLRTIENSISDTLVFSILGYETKYVPITSLEEFEMEILLHIQAYELEEVSIIDNSYIKELLIKAVENIPNNYPNERHRLTGYFQETGITQGEYSHFLEAYLTVENEDYSRKSRLFRDKTNYKYPAGDNHVRYHHIRRSDDTRYLPKRLKKWLGGSIHELLRYNLLYEKSLFGYGNHTLDDLMFDLQAEINNDHLVSLMTITIKEGSGSVGMADKENPVLTRLMQSRFYSLGEQNRDTDTLITIGIKSGLIVLSEDDVETPFFTNLIKLVINKANYAIEKISRSPSDEVKERWDTTSSRNKYTEIQYRKIEGKYYPSFIIHKVGLNYNLETRKEINTTRFIVQKVQTTKDEFVKIKPSKTLKRRYRLIEKRYKYDPEFWHNYQIPERMEAPLALKLALEKEAPLEEQFKRNEKSKD